MFLARRPSPEHIGRFLRESQVLPLSYSPTGIVKANTVREDLDEPTVVIGHGKATCERARAALTAWKQFDIGWVETFPPAAPAVPGTVVAVLIRHLGFWSLNGCRVLYIVDSVNDVARFGFAYGTLTNHAESGKELFEVFIDPQTDEVIYRRALQERFRHPSAGAMKRATACNGVRA